MKRCLMVSGFALLCTIAMLSYAFAIDMTADMITKEGKITRKGKFYSKDNKCRSELGSTPIYTIVRGDKGLLWQVNGAENTYVQAKLTPALKPWVEEKIFGEASRKEIGSETIGGHPTKKYEVTVKQGKDSNTYHQWFATDLRFPVKIANVNGKWSVEYKNIKKGAPPDNVFNLPTGVSLDTMSTPDVLGGH
ncbi:MAG: putative exported protein [Deltaproteobacteria bacterium]|nr:putative exported protein [Deltaproteobacteria bacterium]